MKKKIYILILLVLSIFSCHRRPLEFYDNQYSDIWLILDWHNYGEEKPGGMTIAAFDMDSKLSAREISNETDSIEIKLQKGEYNLMAFNYTPSEFGTFSFHDMNRYNRAWVELNPITMRSPEKWDEGAKYACEPEKLVVAVDKINIEKLNKRYRIYAKPEVVNSTLYIEIYVGGLENMRSVEGSISGMAAGCRLYDITPTKETVVHLLQKPRVKLKSKSKENARGAEQEQEKGKHYGKYNSESQEAADGILRFKLSCLGLPLGKQLMSDRVESDNDLKLHFLLRDNKTEIDYKLNVGRLIKYLDIAPGTLSVSYTDFPSKNLSLQVGEDLGPELPFVVPDGDQESGFDAEVDDWEDGGDITIDV